MGNSKKQPFVFTGLSLALMATVLLLTSSIGGKNNGLKSIFDRTRRINQARQAKLNYLSVS